MPKLRIAIATVVTLAVLCLGVVVATSKGAPVLTVRVVEVTDAGGTLNVKLQLTFTAKVPLTYTNPPALFLSAKLQTWNGHSWESDSREGSEEFTDNGNGSGDLNCHFTSFPSKGRLRIIIVCNREISSLRSYPFRLRQRLLREDHSMSLNPLDGTGYLSPFIGATTAEFRAP